MANFAHRYKYCRIRLLVLLQGPRGKHGPSIPIIYGIAPCCRLDWLPLWRYYCCKSPPNPSNKKKEASLDQFSAFMYVASLCHGWRHVLPSIKDKHESKIYKPNECGVAELLLSGHWKTRRILIWITESAYVLSKIALKIITYLDGYYSCGNL